MIGIPWVPRPFLMVAMIAAWNGIGSGGVAASEQRVSYTVHMSPYGTIGTYQSTKRTEGRDTTITTKAHIKVSVAGVVLYRLELSRTERQAAGRLVYFHGVTTENGNAVEINGKAIDDGFIITSPQGTAIAPGTIRTSDPWSAGEAGTGLVFMPDTGAVKRVSTKGGELTAITIGGATLQVRRYQISTTDGSEQYEIWMDDRRTPVMFNIVDRDGTTTFTMVN